MEYRLLFYKACNFNRTRGFRLIRIGIPNTGRIQQSRFLAALEMTAAPTPLNKIHRQVMSNQQHRIIMRIYMIITGAAAAAVDPTTIFHNDVARSIAIDPLSIPQGAPVFLATTWPNTQKPLNRLMVAQDVGSAIKGGIRADFFWGFGQEAGNQAGKMKQSGKMWVLMPRDYTVPD